jgi:hypothetical protein
MRRRTIVTMFLCGVLVAGMLSAGGAAVARGDAHGKAGRRAHLSLHRVRTTPRVASLARKARRDLAVPGSASALARIAPDLEGIVEPDEEPSEPSDGQAPTAADATVTGDTSKVRRSWEGIRAFDGVWNDNGNTYFTEPPDQGLCVGNGYVVETVNGTFQVYRPDGTPRIPGDPGIATSRAVGLSLNQFYGYPPATTLASDDGSPFGPFVTDPSCYYDRAVRRWFHVVLTLDIDVATGDFTGTNHLDLAVSRSANPLGKWDIYSIAAQNDGTDGTPNHGCEGGYCIGDYPHIGADAYGFYITTNEYAFFGDGYNGVQLYALSKLRLAARTANQVLLLQNLSIPELGIPAFTIRPAQSRPASWDRHRKGTAWFVGGTVGDGYETGITADHHMAVWALVGTRTLGTPWEHVALVHRVVRTREYVHPEHALQRPGPTPFLDCLNAGCFGDVGQQPGPYPLDAGDGRVMSAFMARGVLWTTVDTALAGSGSASWDDEDGTFEPIDERSGVLYVAFRPRWSWHGLKVDVLKQGYVAVAGNNLTYPSLAVTERNRGFIGATLVGPDHFPSPVYVPVGLGVASDTVHVVVEGGSPSDGFSGTAFGGFRPRWGDYGYAVPGHGSSIWMAAEYVSSTCGLDAWLADPNCDDTRTLLTNYTTRVWLVRN